MRCTTGSLSGNATGTGTGTATASGSARLACQWRGGQVQQAPALKHDRLALRGHYLPPEALVYQK